MHGDCYYARLDMATFTPSFKQPAENSWVPLYSFSSSIWLKRQLLDAAADESHASSTPHTKKYKATRHQRAGILLSQCLFLLFLLFIFFLPSLQRCRSFVNNNRSAEIRKRSSVHSLMCNKRCFSFSFCCCCMRFIIVETLKKRCKILYDTAFFCPMIQKLCVNGAVSI